MSKSKSWTDIIKFDVLYKGEYVTVDVVCELLWSPPEPDVDWAGGTELDDYYCVDEKYNEALWDSDESEIYNAWVSYDERRSRVYETILR